MNRSAQQHNHSSSLATDSALFIHQRYEDTAMVIFQQLSKKRGKDRGGKALPLGGGQATLPYQLQVAGQPPQLSPGKTRALPNNSSSSALGQPPSSPASTSGSKPASPASRARCDDGQASGGVAAVAGATSSYSNDSTVTSAIKQSDIILSHPLSNIEPADNTSYGGSLPVDSPLQSSTHSDMTNPTSDNTASVNSTVDSDSESDTAAKLDDTAETDDEKTHVSESRVKAVFIADSGVVGDGQVQPIQHEDLISPLAEGVDLHNHGNLTYDLGPASAEAADEVKNASLPSKDVMSVTEEKPTSSSPPTKDSTHSQPEDVRRSSLVNVKATSPPKPIPTTPTIVSMSDVNTNVPEEATTTIPTPKEQQVEKKNFISEVEVFVSTTGSNIDSNADTSSDAQKDAARAPVYSSSSDQISQRQPVVHHSRSHPLSVKDIAASSATNDSETSSSLDSGSTLKNAESPRTASSASSARHSQSSEKNSASTEMVTGATLKNTEASGTTSRVFSSVRHSDSSDKGSSRSSSAKGGSSSGSPLDRSRVSSTSSVFGASGGGGGGVEFAHYGSSGVVARRKVAMSRSDRSQTQSKVCSVM